MTSISDLASIDFEPGVSAHTGEPYVHVRATSADGVVVLIGQLAPEVTAKLGLVAIEAAANAEHEAALYGLMLARLSGAGDPDPTRKAAAILQDVRAHRGAMTGDESP